MSEQAASAPDDPGDTEAVPSWGPWLLRVWPWRMVLILMGAALGTVAILRLTSKLHSFLFMIMMALFLSFAIEPAVNWLASRGWRRFPATGLVFLGIFLSGAVLLALVIPAVVSGTKQLVESAPGIVDKLTLWLARIGIDVKSIELLDEIKSNGDKIASYAGNFAGNIFGIASSILGGLFRWATIGLFTFYIVAEGPKFRRTICSVLPPTRQKRVLFVWDQAIDKTGGYFYSRLLLAVINGTGMYVTLRVFNVPFAAPLAIFCGVVSEFIPIVGTYIAGAPPILVALLTSTVAGIAALAYVLIYQQIENYFLSPKLTAKTMALNPALAFGAAILGGSLGGVLMAFLALPVAGVVQAAVGAWVHRYAVVEDELTSDVAHVPKEERTGLMDRVRSAMKNGDKDKDRGG